MNVVTRCVMFLSGLALVFYGNGASCGSLITADQLREYTGGDRMDCIGCEPDPESLGCSICEVTGSATSTQCVATTVDKFYYDDLGQNPSKTYQVDNFDCGGNVNVFDTNNYCSGTPDRIFFNLCGVSYRDCLLQVGAPPVNCP
jgi:hypothetical protein